MARLRSCRLCQCTEPDPRRLVETLAWIPRLGHKLAQARVHVECFLAGGGAIADLADSQLWHLSGAAWDHLHFDITGALARQRAADAAEADETARLLAELAAAAAALAVPDYRRGTVRRPPSSPLRALHNPSPRAKRAGRGDEGTAPPLRRAA